jgi:hypothetical protein
MSPAQHSLEPTDHIVFVHIPKTAGTTIRTALAKVYQPEERAFVYHPSVPDSVTMEMIAGWSEERRARLRLVMGHFEFGIHDHLPGTSHYVTMLREPMDRLVSLYDYFRTGSFPAGTGAARQHARLVAEDIAIDAYAFDVKHPRWDNQMVRMLSGRGGVAFGACDEALLADALENIEARFSGILLQERMASSMEALSGLTGRALPMLAGRQRRGGRLRRIAARVSGEVRWQNATRGRRRVSEIDGAALERMRDLNRFDIELYRIAEQRFGAPRSDPPSVPRPS